MILKICGITNSDDAMAAIEAGATALGFNFYPKSPRYIAPENAAAISTTGVKRVGIFVNENRARVDDIALIAALDIAQLHGDETSAEYPAAVPVWKAIRVGPETLAERFAERYRPDPAEALLLDGPASGVNFDWSVATTLLRTIHSRPFHSRPYRIILAGGLDASNVAQAIALTHPWGVDACSRIESAPGRKDHKKMTEFLEAAKAALAV